MVTLKQTEIHNKRQIIRCSPSLQNIEKAVFKHGGEVPSPGAHKLDHFIDRLAFFLALFSLDTVKTHNYVACF